MRSDMGKVNLNGDVGTIKWKARVLLTAVIGGGGGSVSCPGYAFKVNHS